MLRDALVKVTKDALVLAKKVSDALTSVALKFSTFKLLDVTVSESGGIPKGGFKEPAVEVSDTLAASVTLKVPATCTVLSFNVI